MRRYNNHHHLHHFLAAASEICVSVRKIDHSYTVQLLTLSCLSTNLVPRVLGENLGTRRGCLTAWSPVSLLFTLSYQNIFDRRKKYSLTQLVLCCHTTLRFRASQKRLGLLWRLGFKIYDSGHKTQALFICRKAVKEKKVTGPTEKVNYSERLYENKSWPLCPSQG